MTYTYDSTDISTELAQVRLAIGDIVEHEHYSITDEEIEHYIDGQATLAAAKYMCARARYAKAVLYANRSVASVNSDRNSIVTALKELADQLLKDAGGLDSISAANEATILPAAGMMSQDSLDTDKADTDYPDPPFRVGSDDNLGSVVGEDERLTW